MMDCLRMGSKIMATKLTALQSSARQALGPVPRGQEDLYDFSGFEFMGAPRRGEWLHEHPEKGQTFAQFSATRGKLMKSRMTIYIQPLGNLSDDLASYLREVCLVFFLGTKVAILPPLDLESLGVQRRMNDYGLQYHAEQIIDALKLPKDALCLIAVSLFDLYPRESWNFVFGLAKGQKGVFSFARYLDPGVEDLDALFHRSAKVMCHEVGHMFGLKHCIYFKCLMNGSNSAEEASKKPVLLCPICLKKLNSVLPFDPYERLPILQDLWARHLPLVFREAS